MQLDSYNSSDPTITEFNQLLDSNTLKLVHTDIGELTNVASGYNPLYIDSKTRKHLAKLTKQDPPTTIALLSKDQDMATAVALSMVSSWQSRQFNKSNPVVLKDTSVLAPNGSRWSREDIDLKILSKVQVMPEQRHYLILLNTDEMDNRSVERLLKTLEEPASPTTFILLMHEDSEVIPTIKGRIEETVVVAASSLTQQLNVMTMQGQDPAIARESLVLSGGVTTLANAISKDLEVALLARQLLDMRAWSSQETPVNYSQEVNEKINQLATSWQTGGYTTAATTMSPAIRAKTRTLLRLGLRLHNNASNFYLREIAGTKSDMSNTMQGTKPGSKTSITVKQIKNRVLANELAHQQLRANTANKYILASLFVADSCEN